MWRSRNISKQNIWKIDEKSYTEVSKNKGNFQKKNKKHEK